MFRAGYPPCSVFAADQPPLSVARVSVGVVRGEPVCGNPCFLGPPDNPIVRNVGKEQAAGITEPNGSLNPLEAILRQDLQVGVADDVVVEPVVASVVFRLRKPDDSRFGRRHSSPQIKIRPCRSAVRSFTAFQLTGVSGGLPWKWAFRFPVTSSPISCLDSTVPDP